MAAVEGGIFREVKVAIGRGGRNVRSSALTAARESAQLFVDFFKVQKLSGPTSPPHPFKGNAGASGSLSVGEGDTRDSIRRTGISGTDSTEGGALSVKVGVVIGEGIPGIFVHEFGATIRAVNAPLLVFPIVDSAGKMRIISKKQVTIPARLGFRVSFQNFSPSIRARVKSAVRRVGGKVA